MGAGGAQECALERGYHMAQEVLEYDDRLGKVGADAEVRRNDVVALRGLRIVACTHAHACIQRGGRASGPRRLLRSTTRPDAGGHCGMCAPSRKHQRVCDGTRKSLPAAVKHSGAACNVLRARRAEQP